MQESLANLFGKDRFKMNLDMQPSATALAQKKSWNTDPNAYEMTISSWTLSAQDYDPVLALQVYTTARASRNGPYGFAELEEIWAKLDLPENTLDEKNRAAIAMEFEKAMIEHAYAVPIVYGANRGLMSDRIELAVDTYSLDLGWGLKFCDIIQ